MNTEPDNILPGEHFVIRPLQPGDRATVRAICADTGFLGKAIDPVFEDRELFADYLTSYYTDIEPESTFVILLDGKIQGYVMGCRRPWLNTFYHAYHNGLIAFRGIWRCFTRPYNANSRKYMMWVTRNGRKETPATPGKLPHFHINLLPPARNIRSTRALLDTFLEYLAACGEKQVYAQMVTYENRRGERTFARYGFKVLNTMEVTKYREVYPKQIFLFTVIKDLDKNTKLYGNDLARPQD